MTFASASQFHIYLPWVNAFNQEKARVGAFSVIVQLRRLIVCSTNGHPVLFQRCGPAGHPDHPAPAGGHLQPEDDPQHVCRGRDGLLLEAGGG